MIYPKITIFAGLFGSGKTNLAANFALRLKREGRDVVLLDMDVVNPMFRLSELAGVLTPMGIDVITPPYAGTNVDIPALTGAMEAALQAEEKHVVIDLGGDDIGAAALGRFTGAICSAGYEMLYVYNCYRPFSASPKEAFAGLTEIERAAKLRFTHIAANPNLGEETTRETVLRGKRFADALARLSGLKVAFTAVKEGLQVLAGEISGALFPVRIFLNRAGALLPAM